MTAFLKAIAPLVIVIAIVPAPEGLAQYAWYYFAISACRCCSQLALAVRLESAARSPCRVGVMRA
jgi:hypothetical protein